MPCPHESDDSMVEGILDQDGGIYWICPLCEACTGYTEPTECPEELEGLHFEFIPGAGGSDWEH